MNKDIAARFGVAPSSVTRAIHALSRDEAVRALAQVNRHQQTPPVSQYVPVGDPIDVAAELNRSMNLIKALHERLDNTKRRLSGDEKDRMHLRMRAALVTKELVTAAVMVQEKLERWIGAEQVRRVIVSILDQMEPKYPELRAEFLARLQGELALLRAMRDSGARPPLGRARPEDGASGAPPAGSFSAAIGGPR